MANDEVIYTLMHDPTNYKMECYHKGKDWYNTCFFRTVREIRKIFDNEHITKLYTYGPPPYPWNCSVWESIEEWFNDNGMNMEQFFIHLESTTGALSRETVIYGEFLLKTKMIDIYPTANHFRYYTDREAYDWEVKCGLDNNFLRKYYKGACFQDGRSGRVKGELWQKELIDNLYK